jgi:hypothetical protein
MARTRGGYRNGSGHVANGNGGHWSIDKRVPVAIVLAIFLQTVSAVWWASGVHSSMGSHERAIEALQADVRVLQSRNDRIAVLETKLESIAKALERLEASFSKQNGRTR